MHELVEKYTRLPWFFPLILIIVAGGVALGGASSTPLEDHDVLVAQTAQNMLDSGNWIVPDFNDEYRLQKPPLSYWAVAITARILSHSKVTPFVARVPSIIAAIGMALLTYWLSLLLFNKRTALVAALFTITSLGFFTWSHSARPDMLYAFWCTALFPIWVVIGKSDDTNNEKSSARWASLFWIAAGLATLTKGPQAPVILLLALVTHAVASGCAPSIIAKRLRPLRGILILAIILVPWWLLLRHSVGADELANSQLSGSLLNPAAGSHFGFYYFARSPLFWLPWALLLPFGCLAFIRTWRQAPGLLGISIIFALVIFTFGPQYREHYMLPWQVPACTLLAAGMVTLPTSRQWLWLPWTVALVGGIWLIFESGEPALLPFVFCAIALGLAADKLINGEENYQIASLIALGFVAGLLQASGTPSIWSENRFQEAALADATKPLIATNTAVATIDVHGATFVYALNRPVTNLSNADEMCGWLQTQENPMLIIFRSPNSSAMARFLDVEKTITTREGGLSAVTVRPGSQCRERQK